MKKKKTEALSTFGNSNTQKEGRKKNRRRKSPNPTTKD